MIRYLWYFLFIIVAIMGENFDKNPNIIDLKGIKIDIVAKRIEIDGVVNMNEGLVELLATAPGGKEHESILKVYCNPALLHTALLLIGLEKGGGGQNQGDADPLYGSQIYIYASWKSEATEKTIRVEELIKNVKTNTSMDHCTWVFSGSRFSKNQKDGEQIYMANVSGVLIATFYDPDAVINNPLSDRSDDTAYHANKDNLPEIGTKIKLVLSTTEL